MSERDKLVPVTPQLMAATLVPVAADHFKQLHDKLEHFLQSTDDAHWTAVLQELFRVHFCLASFHVCSCFENDDERQNLYGFRMLEFLRHYPENHSEIVKNAFTDWQSVENAVSCYIHNRLTEAEQQGIEHFRGLTGDVDRSHLSRLCEKVCVRIAGRLNISAGDPAAMFVLMVNAGALIAAAKLFKGLKPVLTDEEMQAYTAQNSNFIRRTFQRLFQ